MRRKAWIIILLLLLIFTVTLSGKEDKQMNIWLTFGVSTSQFDNALIDLGFELQLTKRIYFQVVANSHMGSDRYYGSGYYNHYPYGYNNNYNYYYYGGRSVSINFSAGGIHGLSTYAMFKVPLSKRVSIYAKGGVHMTFYDEYRYYGDYYSSSGDSTTGFGAAAGGGLSYTLTKKVGIMGGATYKLLFNGSSTSTDSSKIDWFKFYVGVYYGIK